MNEKELTKTLAKLRKNIEMGRTAGREKLDGAVLFWSLAQSQQRGPLHEGGKP